MAKVHHRIVSGEAWFLLVPTTVAVLFLTFFAAVLVLRFSAASVLVFANGVLALAALFATIRVFNVYEARGDEGLVSLPAHLLIAMVAGLVMVALGGLALLIEYVASPVDTGAMGFNLLGLPAVVPCIHLLWLRSRACRRLASTRTLSGRRWLAPVVLGLAFPALQWLATGPLPFDRGRWDALAEARNDPWFQRQRMSDWLILDASLVGRSRADVIARLGLADADYDGAIVYQLGDSRDVGGFGNDLLWLELDARDRVTRVEITNDD